MSSFVDYIGEEFESEPDLFTAPRVGQTWRELCQEQLTDAEKIIFGLGRGQLGMTVSSTNVGKTTFALNVTLTLASGGSFPPFVLPKAGGLRVMYIDGESTKAELRADLERMTSGWSDAERESVKDNLLVVCDEAVDDEPLTLSNPRHMELVVGKARAYRPDVIIVDTMAALFNLHNENDNAEVKRVVIQPLKVLARESDAVVWLQHHSGKQSEDASASNAAYSGRGGSNFGCLARTVLRLSAPDRSDKGRVVLSVAKSKGYRLDDVVMRLDFDSRWFCVTGETPPVAPSSYEKTVRSVSREMTTTEIVEAGERLGNARRTTEQNLNAAVKNGRLLSVKRGVYAPPETAATASAIAGAEVAEVAVSDDPPQDGEVVTGEPTDAACEAVVYPSLVIPEILDENGYPMF